MMEDVEYWRGQLIEAVAEYDDKLMEKFFDDPNTITEDEVHEAVRKATLDLSIVPMMCGSSFKNKGVQTALDAVCRYLPSPMDMEDTVVLILIPENRLLVSQMLKNHLRLLHLKS